MSMSFSLTKSLQNTFPHAFPPFADSLSFWVLLIPQWLGLQGDMGLALAVPVLTVLVTVYFFYSRRPRQTIWRLTKSRGPRKSANHKALIIGVAHVSGHRELDDLDAAHSDAQRIFQFLLKNGWDQDRIIKLVDTRDSPSNLRPTEANIKRSMRKLVENARAGDELFLYVATHGFQRDCKGGDEEDLKDELIYSCDGCEIVDNTLFDIAIKPLPKGCKMTVLFDTCSAGTGMDLPYRTDRGISEEIMPKQLPMTSVKPKMRESNGSVVMWASCHDGQASLEIQVTEGNKTYKTGAFTHTFLQEFRSSEFGSDPSHRNLYGRIRNTFLEKEIPHEVQLSSSLPLNVDDRFSV
ncbi:hypothetical protein SISNIDRAFT_491167 [Sistotremastrum niveocremeum HHB9708]|uniref:Peptidase C14 n=1 Tax=Sistotremastrum niveocremeum HHB9708 TaxID=1314777 RepID=A0A164N3F0_9AGAM|nr:hypothetical protein SISNIDRAFT_491167 [Sistotremastrum niveocremeum HHB9708]